MNHALLKTTITDRNCISTEGLILFLTNLKCMRRSLGVDFGVREPHPSVIRNIKLRGVRLSNPASPLPNHQKGLRKISGLFVCITSNGTILCDTGFICCCFVALVILRNKEEYFSFRKPHNRLRCRLHTLLLPLLLLISQLVLPPLLFQS